jgi:zinc transport system ATP-binding protein
VSFAYGRRAVLDGVGLRVEAGEFVALAGPNGSGKSTFLRILLGLLAPAGGRVRLLGEEPADLRQRWRVGYVPQRAAVGGELPVTVDELVLSGRLHRGRWVRRPTPEDRDEVDHALASVALTDLRRARVAELSGGEQQRAFIARALVNRPDLLVLDEPVAGVDAPSQARFRDALVHLVAEHGAAVLLVSHELGAVADDLHRVVVLQGGRIGFDGPPAALAARGVSLGVHHSDLPLWLEGLG